MSEAVTAILAWMKTYIVMIVVVMVMIIVVVMMVINVNVFMDVLVATIGSQDEKYQPLWSSIGY